MDSPGVSGLTFTGPNAGIKIPTTGNLGSGSADGGN